MSKQELEGNICEACGSWEFECRDEQYFCVTCQLPVKEATEQEEKEKKEEKRH